MITTSEVEDILYGYFKNKGKVFRQGTEPLGEVKEERIQLIVKEQSKSKYWNSGFVEVNFLIPNINNMPDIARLGEVEKDLSDFEEYGKHGGVSYTFGTYSTVRLKDEALKCWFVNCRILFESLNTKL